MHDFVPVLSSDNPKQKSDGHWSGLKISLPVKCIFITVQPENTRFYLLNKIITFTDCYSNTVKILNECDTTLYIACNVQFFFEFFFRGCVSKLKKT